MRLYRVRENSKFIDETVMDLKKVHSGEREELLYTLKLNRDKQIYFMWKKLAAKESLYLYNDFIADAAELIAKKLNFKSEEYIYVRIYPSLFCFQIKYRTESNKKLTLLNNIHYKLFGLNNVLPEKEACELSLAFTYCLWCTLVKMYPDIYIETIEYDLGLYEFKAIHIPPRR